MRRLSSPFLPPSPSSTVLIRLLNTFALVELFYDRGNHYEFLSLVQELANPGEMRTAQAFDFEFRNVEKQFESYHGINVKLRYVLLSSSSLIGRRRNELELILLLPPSVSALAATSFASPYRVEWQTL